MVRRAGALADGGGAMVERRHRLLWWLFLIGMAVAMLLWARRADAADPIPQKVQLLTRGFEHIATKHGVRVYKHIKSPIIRLGADGILNAPVKRVFATLLDYKRQVGVIDRLSESKVIARGSHYLIVYQRLNLPVISDRDFSLRVWWTRQDGVTTIRYVAMRNKGAGGHNGAVHVKHHEGSWQLQPIRGGLATQARFEVTIDMGGWLPRWLAKSGSGKEVPQLFKAINSLLAGKRSMACPGSKSL